jgi:hypothetical protein
VEDLDISVATVNVRAATTEDVDNLNGHAPIDGATIQQGSLVLVHHLEDEKINGVYRVEAAGAPWTRLPNRNQPAVNEFIEVERGTENQGIWRRKRTKAALFRFVPVRINKMRLGSNLFLRAQLIGASFARIYGFSFEGAYYDLPRPVLFLVHGEGEPATKSSRIIGDITGASAGTIGTRANLSRAPREPSRSGVGAADFQLADDLRVWSYDKADFTIRMDVESGMFEQVLFDLVAGDSGGNVSGAMVRGAMVRGAMVRGAMVRGAMVRGAMVRGAMVRGGRGDASD